MATMTDSTPLTIRVLVKHVNPDKGSGNGLACQLSRFAPSEPTDSDWLPSPIRVRFDNYDQFKLRKAAVALALGERVLLEISRGQITEVSDPQ
jgi:hypothetical protein